MPSKRGPREQSVRESGKITLHELAIRDLVDSDSAICRNGFNAAMRALAAELGIDEEMPLNIRPDAFKVDRENEVLTLFEVGDWRLASHDKELRLGDFWYWWDDLADDWTVKCLAVNRFGRVTHEMDLCGFYLDGLSAHMPRYREILRERSTATGG